MRNRAKLGLRNVAGGRVESKRKGYVARCFQLPLNGFTIEAQQYILARQGVVETGIGPIATIDRKCVDRSITCRGSVRPNYRIEQCRNLRRGRSDSGNGGVIGNQCRRGGRGCRHIGNIVDHQHVK